MKTFIKYSGNKSQHINKFKEYFPEFKGTYIEPFLGSGAVFLYLEPKRWIINDLNKDIINLWESIKSNSEEVINKIKEFGKVFIPLEKDKKIKLCRLITNELECQPYDAKRATHYILMKNCAYMNNIIVNNKFYFTGIDLHILSKNKYYFLIENYYRRLKIVRNYLNNTNGKIYNKDYSYVLKKAKKGDFVFLDPPYIENHDYHFNYNQDEKLDNTFLTKLLLEVKKLDLLEVKWMMTQSDTKEVRRIFKEYNIKTYEVYRVGQKKYVKELIIMNY